MDWLRSRLGFRVAEILWKQALIDPQARREQEAEEKVKEEAAAKSKPPEPTAEEQSKKLTSRSEEGPLLSTSCYEGMSL
ncbi:hypothetical protein CCHR01_02635 [Colletotrichum chrysophilum]|uniref:Uncharacterized protein n=1 Tax=Colletotrichum chrysophilum TaxID=1836956 RepID=A0AAD9AWL3_9PEZI|nr:hypothetical protein CCHR01_02635 [Colletotrichum chrysophilum]